MAGARRVLRVLLGLLAADIARVLIWPDAGGGALLALRLLAAAALIVALPVPRRALWLLLLPALLHFSTVGGRLSGDGVMYYVQLRSLLADGDIDLANEYQAMGLLERPELRAPLRSGLRRTVFSIGPALLGAPFYALAEGLGRAGRALGRPADLTGFGPLHVNAVALGGLLYGFAAVWVMETALRRHFALRTARAAAVLLWGASFLYWYMVQQPTMAHAQSTFLAALFIDRWDRRRARDARAADAVVLGLLGGLAMCVRWQNAVLLALPAWDLARAALAGRGGQRALGRAALLGGATLLAALPQMLVWHAIFGVWVLAAPPQGTDFVRLTRPFVLDTLFSSRHGLFSWTPLLAVGYLGFVPLLRRRPGLAGPLLVPLLVITYVNMCSGDWWAGGSFSNRRFDSLLPVLAFGLAAAWEAARVFLRRHPGASVAALVAAAVAWNAAVVDARRHGALPADDTVALEQVVHGAAAAGARHLGSPTTWPASWLFAARHHLPPDRYDLLVGRYLFYRQNNQRGCVEPGRAAVAAQLEGAWHVEDSGREPVGVLEGPGRVWVGLDLPEDLDLALRVRAPAAGPLTVDVNGVTVAEHAVGPEWTTARVAVPGLRWRRDLNAVGLRGPERLEVRGLRFARAQGEPPAECGMEAS
jgi:hypothetical protein